MLYKASSHEQPGDLAVALDVISTDNFEEFCEFIHMAEEQGAVVFWRTKNAKDDPLVVDRLNAMRGVE